MTRKGAAPRWSSIIVRGLGGRGLFFSALCIVAACGGSTQRGPKPEPALSADSVAQVRIRDLSEKWHSASPERRQQLEAPLRQYLEEFPYDAPRRRAWVYLAWILVQRGELLEARELIDRVKSGPPGSVSDFAFVTEAALLIELNQPQEALRLLRPVRPKLIDPVERSLATEQLVLAALGSELHGEALLYMIDWGAGAPQSERAAIRESISSHISRTPRRYLEKALLDMAEAEESEREVDPARREQEQWQRDAITQELTAIAVNESDPELARFVLEQSDLVGSEPGTAEDLIGLATKSGSNAAVHGRTLGLVLVTGTAEQRRRSSEVAAAVATTLGLPLSAKRADAVRLVFAQDTGGPNGATEAFKSLAMQGAALVIGGVDSNAAQHHSWQAERNGIPVLLLHAHELPRVTWSFTRGTPRESEEGALREELARRGARNPRGVAPDDGVCLEDSAREVSLHFRTWASEGADSVIYVGGKECAAKLLAAEDKRRPPLLLGFGLEAALTAGKGSERVFSLGAERYPLSPPSQELDAWLERHGKPPSWYEALGHDAAALAGAVLQALPAEELTRPEDVSKHYDRVRARLLVAGDVPLWTAAAPSFGPRQTLLRAFHFQPPAPALVESSGEKAR